jgi:hypothetical protein
MAKSNIVDNKKLYENLILYRETGNNKYYNAIGRDLIKIARHFMNHKRWRGHTADFKVDMESLALFYMTKAIHKIDLEKFSNPFSYFTTTATNGFKQAKDKNMKWDGIIYNFENIEDCGDRNENVYTN